MKFLLSAQSVITKRGTVCLREKTCKRFLTTFHQKIPPFATLQNENKLLERDSINRPKKTWLYNTTSRNCSILSAQKFTPRRACLYVPGNDERKLNKITNLNVDCVVMDCEDGVALNRKKEARSTISRMLDELDFGGSEPVVRVNSVSSGLAEDDLRVTLQAATLPPTLMLPKVEHPKELDWFSDKLKSALSGRSLSAKLKLIIFVESAIGMLNLRAICERGQELEASGPFQMEGIVFGSDDYCANIGATRTTQAKELLYARQFVVLVAKAFRLQAIDMVHINFKDIDGLRIQSGEGAQMGFTGKQVIHPMQVPVVQESFTPSSEKVEWASELIKAFEQHQKSGKGAFLFRGSMIDMPLLLQARNIVQMMDHINVTEQS